MTGDEVAKITASTGDFIGSANNWGATSLMVYVTLFLVLVVMIMFFVINRNANSWTRILMDLQKDTNNIIQQNTNVIGKVLDTLKEHNTLLHEAIKGIRDSEIKLHSNSEKLTANGEKLNEILQHTKEIKENLKGKNG